MLGEISQEQFLEWQVFDSLDPFPEVRQEWGLAHVVQAVMRDGRPLGDFQLPLGDRPAAIIATQTVEYQEMILDAWFSTSNAIFSTKRGE